MNLETPQSGLKWRRPSVPTSRSLYPSQGRDRSVSCRRNFPGNFRAKHRNPHHWEQSPGSSCLRSPSRLRSKAVHVGGRQEHLHLHLQHLCLGEECGGAGWCNRPQWLPREPQPSKHQFYNKFIFIYPWSSWAHLVTSTSDDVRNLHIDSIEPIFHIDLKIFPKITNLVPDFFPIL